jgi:hypothetical protein
MYIRTDSSGLYDNFLIIIMFPTTIKTLLHIKSRDGFGLIWDKRKFNNTYPGSQLVNE